MKVLIVEDDSLTRDGLAELLGQEGYEIAVAENGESALSKFSEVQPDFVCLDVMMPKMSGYEVCRHIRQLDDQVTGRVAKARPHQRPVCN